MRLISRATLRRLATRSWRSVSRRARCDVSTIRRRNVSSRASVVSTKVE